MIGPAARRNGYYRRSGLLCDWLSQTKLWISTADQHLRLNPERFSYALDPFDRQAPLALLYSFYLLAARFRLAQRSELRTRQVSRFPQRAHVFSNPPLQHGAVCTHLFS